MTRSRRLYFLLGLAVLLLCAAAAAPRARALWAQLPSGEWIEAADCAARREAPAPGRDALHVRAGMRPARGCTGTVVAEQDKTNLAAVVIEIAQFERMQARRQRNLSALFEQRMFSVVINHHPAADTQDGAVVGSERKGIDPGCRNVDIPPENHPDGPAAGSRTRETDRIDDTTAAGSVNAGSSVPRVRGYWAKRRPFHSPSDSGRGSDRQTGETRIQT